MQRWKRPNRLVLTFKQHFPVVAFSLVALLLWAGLELQKHSFWPAAGMGAVLCLLCTTYYLGYTYSYRKILSHSPQQDYLYKIFSLWGVLAFGALWLFLFAFVGALLDQRFPASFFNGSGFIAIIEQLIFLCADFFLLGIPKTILPAIGADIPKGWAGNAFLSASSTIFKVSLIAAIVATWNERREAKKEAQQIFKFIEKDHKVSPTYQAKLVAQLARQYAGAALMPDDVNAAVIRHLREVKTKEGCDLAFLIAQSTSDEKIFSAAVDYLVTANDRRIARLERHVKEGVLREALHRRVAPKNPKRPRHTG